MLLGPIGDDRRSMESAALAVGLVNNGTIGKSNAIAYALLVFDMDLS